MSRDDLAAFIRRTIDKAMGSGIAREVDVCKFLDVTMALGTNFDEDKEFAWAREVLTDASLGGAEKIDRLVKAALGTAAQAGPPDE